jgi:hypothetical protein
MVRVELSQLQKDYYCAILTKNYPVLASQGAPTSCLLASARSRTCLAVQDAAVPRVATLAVNFGPPDTGGQLLVPSADSADLIASERDGVPAGCRRQCVERVSLCLQCIEPVSLCLQVATSRRR